MKKKFLYIVQVLVFLFMSTSAYAALTYTNPDKVKSLATYAVGNIGVGMISTAMTNPANCPHTDTYKIYKITDTTDHGKNMYAMVLAAKAAKNDIRLMIDNDICVGGYAVIQGIISM